MEKNSKEALFMYALAYYTANPYAYFADNSKYSVVRHTYIWKDNIERSRKK